MKKSLIIAFGSQVKGKTNEMSDYDFAVLQENSLSLADRVDISEYLANKFKINEDKIDLIDLSLVSPMLKFEVAKVGKLVAGTAFDFIRFKVRAMKEYQDTAKFRRIRKNIMLQNHVA